MASPRMVADIEVYRSANVFIREYGKDADVEAPMATNVRFGSKADIPRHPVECPLLGAKRTFKGSISIEPFP